MSLNSKIFRNDKLPNIEVRYAETINNCDRKHAHNEITITAIRYMKINSKSKMRRIF
ncbi:hypothetical protein [Clostridium arbusti]|uniref:hypothetical protein n=1 Tax=Clostridium arbusti TaxID=1137848 RepID=UPI0002897535|nr:hypothetical protein [Clostridium arbusti]